MAVKKAVAKKSPTRAKKAPAAKADSIKKQEVQAVFQSPLSSLTEKQRRALTLGILVVLILGALVYYYKGKFVAATVNGKPIFRSAVVQQLEMQYGKQTLDSLVTQQLIIDEAQAKGSTATDKEIDSEIKKIEDQLKAQGQTLEAALAAQGLTRDYIVNQTRIQILLQKLLANKLKVSDKEVADFLEKNKEALPKDTKEEDLKKQAKAQIENQKLGEEVQKLITDLKAKAKINTYAQY